MTRDMFNNVKSFKTYDDYIRSFEYLDGMIYHVCSMCKIEPRQFWYKGGVYQRRWFLARHLFVYAVLNYTTLNYDEISDILNMSKPTVYNYIKRLKNIEYDYELDRLIRRFNETIKYQPI